MKVLIVYASKYGSTGGVAEAMGETLRTHGHHVDVLEAASAPAPDAYGAAIVGSGVYMGSWLKPGSDYLEAHAASLRQRPVWLFGVGPLGHDDPQPAGDIEQAKKLAELVGAREYRTLTGALDRSRLSFFERMIIRVVKAPDGDYRDWEAIRAWASDIAAALEPEAAADVAGANTANVNATAGVGATRDAANTTTLKAQAGGDRA